MMASQASDLAYEAIRRAIIEGRHGEGERLTEAELAAQVGVSRTPIREALRRLSSEGFVTLRANAGAHVTPWGAKEVRDLFEIRAALESLGAALASQRARAADTDRLSEMCDQMEAAAAERGPRFLEEFSVLNNRFHASILKLSGNDRLASMAGSLMQLGVIMRTYNRFDADRIARSCADHRSLVAAIGQGNLFWAESTMRAHILSSIGSVEAAERAARARSGRRRPSGRP